MTFALWEYTGSNRGPSACKADALNQLSYAPIISNQPADAPAFLFWDGKDKCTDETGKYFLRFFSEGYIGLIIVEIRLQINELPPVLD